MTLQQLVNQKSQKEISQDNKSRPKSAYNKINTSNRRLSKVQDYYSHIVTPYSGQTREQNILSQKQALNVSSNQSLMTPTQQYYNQDKSKQINEKEKIKKILIGRQRPTSSYSQAQSRRKMFQQYLDDTEDFSLNNKQDQEKVYIPQNISFTSSGSPRYLSVGSRGNQSSQRIVASPSKEFLKAKKILSIQNDFKLDSDFKGPLYARCLECKIYNGPGKNHNQIGQIQKNGVISITNRIQDGTWLQIVCANVQGWILSSNVDTIIDRKLYEEHDQSYIQDNQKCKQIVYSLQALVIRDKPQWGSHSLYQIKSNTPLMLRAQDASAKWTEVVYELKDKPPIIGWIPIDLLNLNNKKGYSQNNRDSQIPTQELQLDRPGNIPFQGIATDNVFEAYDDKSKLISFQKYSLPSETIQTLKTHAIGKLLDLRSQARSIDEREARKRALLIKFLKKFINMPLMLAFKRWNFFRVAMKQQLMDQKQVIRARYFNQVKETQQNIVRIKESIIRSKRNSKQEYDSKYQTEQKIIQKAEDQLQQMKNIMVSYQKRKLEQNLEINKSRMVSEKQTNAAQVRTQRTELDRKAQAIRNYTHIRIISNDYQLDQHNRTVL